MLDSRMAWLSVGASRTDLDATSSASLLHSIYGSQASQLPFSDYESDTSLQATQSEFVPPSHSVSPVAQRRYLNRPKSSPAATLLAREQQKKALLRPGSAMGGQRLRPATARSGAVRPGSAAARGRQRPSSAFPSMGGGGGAGPRRTRPRTALGMRRSHGSTVLLDLEEEEEEGMGTRVGELRDTAAPVRVTRVPEYFNFWNMKPIQKREFSVPQHSRKTWRRPKSDYGNRFLGRRRGGDDDEEGGRRGRGDGDLATLLEGDGSMNGSDGRGRRGAGDGGDGDGRDGSGTDGKGGSQSDLDGKDGEGNKGDDGRDRKDGRDSDRDWRSKFDNRGKNDRDSRWGSRGDQGLRNKGTAWGDEDGTEDAKDDRYFKENEKEDFLLPSIPSAISLIELTEPEDKKQNFDSIESSKLPELPPVGRKVEKENAVPASAANREKGVEGSVGSARQALLPVVAKPNAGPKKAIAATSWMDGRSTSHKTTRFELPMDIRTLQEMSPLQYLKRHSIISDRRLAHCSKIFTKLDRNRDSKLDKEELLVGLVEVHHHCITTEQANSVLELVQFPPDLLVDLRMFAAISCIAERMFQLTFLPIARREVIETVDFEALDWKLRDCTISTPLRTLFSRL